MGFWEDNELFQAEGAIKRAQQHLDNMKINLATAKKNGNFKNASKTWYNGKPITGYEYNVCIAKENLAKAKANLAETKRRIKENKQNNNRKGSTSSSRNSSKNSSKNSSSNHSYESCPRSYDSKNYSNDDNANSNEGCLKSLGCWFKILFFPYVLMWWAIKWSFILLKRVILWIIKEFNAKRKQ